MIDLAQLEKKSSIPIKEQLKSRILDQIQKGHWQKGDCIPSINQLSKGLSIARETVRQTLESLVEKEVLIPEHGKGYFVNGRENRMLRIGLLGKIDGIYIRPICDGLLKVLKKNTPLLILDSQKPTKSSAELIQNLAYHQSIDRLLVIPVRGQEESLSRAIDPYRRYFKIAWLDRAPKNCKDAQFLCDYQEAVRIGLKEFEKKGIQKRIYFSRNADDGSVFSIMRKAFCDFEKKTGNKNHVYRSIEDLIKGVDLLNPVKNQTVGIYTETNQEALYLQSHLIKQGLNIPQEVSVISCDDTDLCELVTPKISSIDPGFYELGKLAGTWIKKEQETGVTEIQKISPQFIQRESNI